MANSLESYNAAASYATDSPTESSRDNAAATTPLAPPQGNATARGRKAARTPPAPPQGKAAASDILNPQNRAEQACWFV